jgi:NADH-quinone oxidoreductase subunit L
MENFAWLIPFFPLAGFLLISFLPKSLPKGFFGALAAATILGSFLLSVFQFVNSTGEPIPVKVFDWISSGNLHIPFSFLIDPLSILMLLVVTGIGFLIHVYSIGYMIHDERFPQFMSYLNLFVFFMLLLVMGDNYIVMFTGWEGVGLCSYLLIGFWFKKTDYNNAAKKAFIMNRIGDLGFILGIFLIWVTFGSVTYSDVFSSAEGFTKGDTTLLAITLLLFIGAMGKSAQIPLYTWLPDAMAGPTPVSALIHAATMVTAGIYMIARSNILYTLAPGTLDFIMIIGMATALMAATIGLFQNDIKKVLAYSTVSQLGYMFIGLGAGAYTAGVFHLVTHAFFKALLFLGAGSVIHAMGGEQDIRKMGGLKGHIPITYWTFLLATIAIAGLPPFAGFFSKDEILAHVYAHSPILWGFGILGSMMTAFYMFRLLFLTFFGKFRGTKHQFEHLHESPLVMTVPLMVLAVLSVVGGFLNVPEVLGGGESLKHFLKPVFEASELRSFEPHISHTTETMLMGFAVLLAGFSIFLAYTAFITKDELPVEEEEMSWFQRLVYNKYYVDEAYDTVIVKPLHWISGKTEKYVEGQIIDGAVEGSGTFTLTLSGLIRQLQTGHIGFYLIAMVLAVVFIFSMTVIF